MTSFERKFVLKETFSEVSKFEKKKRYFSDQETHFSAPWRFNVTRLDGSFGSYLYCDLENGKDGWEIEAEFEMKLISPKEKHSSRKFKKTSFNEKSKNWGMAIIKWEDLLKKYVADDKITMEVHVKITKTSGIVKKRLRNFDEKEGKLTNVTLIIEDRKFNVLRGILAAQSSFFKTLFFENAADNKKKKIFELEDVDPDDFQDFLDAIYGELAIHNDNIERLLKLAEIYDAPTVTKRCEQFLLYMAPELPLKEKLRISAEFQLKNLESDCLSKIVSITDIREVLPANLIDMDKSTMAAILEKTLSLPELN